MWGRSSVCLMSAAILAVVLTIPAAAKPGLAAQMYASIKKDPVSTVYFDRNVKVDDIGKLCNASDCYEIGFYTWETKEHIGRRLLVFGLNEKALTYLGGYGVTGRPVAIVGAKIKFPFPKEWGDEIDFSAGPPRRAWLDGENPEFFK